MAKKPMGEVQFSGLYDKICHETDSKQKKFDLLYYSKGFFNASQASLIIGAYRTIPEKVEIIKILESRLCRMTCEEAKHILETFPITNNDRLFALDKIKRVLIDHSSAEGMEYILAAFDFERDKISAMCNLQTVTDYTYSKVAAGGHQGYGAVGGLHSQNWPLNEHTYGALEDQMCRLPGMGEVAIAPHVKPDKIPSLYKSHPSYVCPPDITYQETRQYPGKPTYPTAFDQNEATYPCGGPPLGFHQSTANPIGFNNVN